MRYAREMARIEVQDTGPGLTAEEIERIFEPLRAADRAVAARRPRRGRAGPDHAKMLTASWAAS